MGFRYLAFSGTKSCSNYSSNVTNLCLISQYFRVLYHVLVVSRSLELLSQPHDLQLPKILFIWFSCKIRLPWEACFCFHILFCFVFVLTEICTNLWDIVWCFNSRTMQIMDSPFKHWSFCCCYCCLVRLVSLLLRTVILKFRVTVKWKSCHNENCWFQYSEFLLL